MSSNSRKRRTRKHRRFAKAVLKHGSKAKPRHQSKSGRSGNVLSTQLKGQHKAKSPRGAGAKKYEA